MTLAEYVQLKAFARIDGIYLSILWIAGFVCFLCGLSRPLLGNISVFLAVASPIFAAIRLRKFRDYARDGIISCRRSMAYYMLMFLYASIIFALAQVIYFEFIDGGYLVRAYNELFSQPEIVKVFEQYGLSKDTLNGAIAEIDAASSISIAVSIMEFNIIIGIILSIPVGLLIRRDPNKILQR